MDWVTSFAGNVMVKVTTSDLAPSSARAKTADGSVTLHLPVSQPVDDASLVDIVWAHFHFHHIASGNLDKVFAEFPGNVGQHHMAIGELDPEHGSRQYSSDLSFDLDYFLIGHKFPAWGIALVSSCLKT